MLISLAAAARLAVALPSSVVFKGSLHQLLPAFVTIISTKTHRKCVRLELFKMDEGDFRLKSSVIQLQSRLCSNMRL